MRAFRELLLVVGGIGLVSGGAILAVRFQPDPTPAEHVQARFAALAAQPAAPKAPARPVSALTRGLPKGPERAAAVQEDVIAGLRRKRTECEKGLRDLGQQALKVVPRGSDITVQFNDALWWSLDHQMRVKMSLAVYCAHMPEDGLATVVLYARDSGKRLGSVVNGNWMPD